MSDLDPTPKSLRPLRDGLLGASIVFVLGLFLGVIQPGVSAPDVRIDPPRMEG